MDWWTSLAACIALLWIFCFIDGKRGESGDLEIFFFQELPGRNSFQCTALKVNMLSLREVSCVLHLDFLLVLQNKHVKKTKQKLPRKS